MFVEPSELYTHLYPESIAAISGDDERLLIDALSAGTSEVKGYLHAFDLDKLFSAQGTDRDSLLVMRVKDVAIWHYINIANPNINYADREKRYRYSIEWLKGVQKGDIVPDFPKQLDPNGDKINTSQFATGSNPKRDNHV
ncbi:DUF1320 domain-containing protein [Dysgonomonas sp. ZJ709]|uniref:DUF1320 domain-containing protein n=1 Tax=Dysgonomonas sp. ZJ709 TaxID=2709797 RepID=UPI0013EC2716|nr:DUF1320 domain-containing protein [Dysgonomonas sp. ZJ709]